MPGRKAADLEAEVMRAIREKREPDAAAANWLWPGKNVGPRKRRLRVLWERMAEENDIPIYDTMSMAELKAQWKAKLPELDKQIEEAREELREKRPERFKPFETREERLARMDRPAPPALPDPEDIAVATAQVMADWNVPEPGRLGNKADRRRSRVARKMADARWAELEKWED